MAEELLEEWRKFSLTEDEGPGVTLEDDAMGASKALGTHCLLGRLLTGKLFKQEVFKGSMLRLWGVARGITAHTIGDNLFVFKFPDSIERSRVMKGTPWLFDNCLVLLQDFDGSRPANQIQFTWCCFWVQFHGVPLLYMTKQIGERVRGIFGSVEAVDVLDDGVGWGPYLRVRVHVDITKPIPRGRLVTFGSIGQLWISFKYERLPWLCFKCGIIGHLERECVAQERNGSGSAGGFQQYGSWLRATDSTTHWRGLGGGRVGYLGSVAPRGVRRDANGAVQKNTKPVSSGGRSTVVGDDAHGLGGSSMPKNPVIPWMCVDKVGCLDELEVLDTSLLTPTGAPSQDSNLNVPKSIMHATGGVDKLNGHVVGSKELNKDSNSNVLTSGMHATRGVDRLNATVVGSTEPNKVPVQSIFSTLQPNLVDEACVQQQKTTPLVVLEVGQDGKTLEAGGGFDPQDVGVFCEGKSTATKKGKFYWKRLAREKGKGVSTNTKLEGTKRGVELSGVIQTASGCKRAKVGDGECVPTLSLSVEAATQPRREP
ncbi:hypothetical protein FCV25MIE_02411 [Fagus crenata]